jgi:predicted enzyme related to lactoylglutathione lyase
MGPRGGEAAGAESCCWESERMGQEEQDRRIDYIEFVVGDLGRAKEFYEAVFGWEFTDYGFHYASFNDGRMRGGFRSDLKHNPGGALIVIYSTDLKGIEDKIRQNGGAIVKDLFEFPGGRRFHFTDPSGNEIAVWSDK